MDTIKYDEQDLFIVDFARNIHNITDENDNDIKNSDNFEEIHEENIQGRGSNRGRERERGRERGRDRGRNNNSERDNNNDEQIAQLPPPPSFNAF
ncbi:unnamed protein product [Rhizophagus irregularis]|uniref:Uncharacterized protein n=1 Tax=Rhizophagus irregularis TaxID=588596 RepID=A0A915YMM8_9GLOM|nr:unnamed protein product [Rhizophagus irregularis]CAB5132550.1 unnamed protein product [Rhizophagus irregularis]CAB5293137.1 unnamed protein product [Rhizophagus irregularis]